MFDCPMAEVEKSAASISIKDDDLVFMRAAWLDPVDMKIVIPNDYQDMDDKLECFDLIRHHEVVRYREPAASFDELVKRLADADVLVAVRERVDFSRALLERLPKLKLL